MPHKECTHGRYIIRYYVHVHLCIYIIYYTIFTLSLHDDAQRFKFSKMLGIPVRAMMFAGFWGSDDLRVSGGVRPMTNTGDDSLENCWDPQRQTLADSVNDPWSEGDHSRFKVHPTTSYTEGEAGAGCRVHFEFAVISLWPRVILATRKCLSL